MVNAKTKQFGICLSNNGNFNVFIFTGTCVVQFGRKKHNKLKYHRPGGNVFAKKKNLVFFCVSFSGRNYGAKGGI